MNVPSSLRYLAIIPLVLLFSFSMVGMTRVSVYAEFDSAGNYVCNPFDSGLETNIFISTVNQINEKLEFYKRSYPNSTEQRQHDFIMSYQKTWDLYNKSKACIEALGVNSDQVAPLSEHVKQAIAIPEFGLIPPIVVTLAMIASIVIYRKFF
ncbi:MAG: hypothetical protein E6K98_04280 [Thaumarchaeota archaeon]|nr:MAG: hypothetical protein E6K98_04280 [Nitrososphaerota archaeon]TLX94597.1 MAG: hypothetical protein E6K91_05920 [Nitrososphaerota archaeon]